MNAKPLNLLRLAGANIRYKALPSSFNVGLLALSVAFILMIVHLNDQIDRRFTKDLAGIDLVVSGKGSPLQIILANVFHLDIPTGNIPDDEAQKLAHHPMVKSAIPLALGDNYNGYRIVGTTPDYITHYAASLETGRIFKAPMEIVLGSEVAAQFKLNVDDSLVGAHGLVNSADLHADFPYKVVGILKPTGGVIDRLVLTEIDSVWHVHEHPDADDPDEVAYKADHPWREITALLISYKTPLAAAQLPRFVNKSSAMQAASPAFEMARLNKLMGTGKDMLAAFDALLMMFAALGLFITLYSSVKDREYDIAMMRVMGASRRSIAALVMVETLALGILGSIVGILLSRLGLEAASYWIETTKHIILGRPPMGLPELYALGSAAAISILAGIGPTLNAHRIPILKILANVS